eukprot:3823755-Rhodomonas_salina.2
MFSALTGPLSELSAAQLISVQLSKLCGQLHGDGVAYGGLHVAFPPTVLRARYAVSGTDIGLPRLA